MSEALMFLMGSSLLVLAIAAGLFVLWIWAVIDTIKSDFKDSITKLIWIALLIFLPILGALIYFFMGKATKIRPNCNE
ncbi:MAG: PLD nuclease N-terminal domain-containing protein [Campylobacterales bacterium]|nr:PLD nuclease N-terminal domain-containing protein [Campylobacterales bacterium]